MKSALLSPESPHVPIQRRSPYSAAAWMMRITATAVLVVHGLIHVIGFMLLWRIAQLGQLRYAGMHPTPGTAAGIAVGAVWLVAAVLFTTTGVLLIIRKAVWRPAALVGRHSAHGWAARDRL